MLNRFQSITSIVTVLVLSALIFAGCLLAASDFAATRTLAANTSDTVVGDTHMSHMHNPKKEPERKGATAPTNANEVAIENFAFRPATLTVKPGTKVTWINHDDEPHTATEDDKRFNSKTLDTNEQFSFTFTQPGTYHYFCALHPKMTGQIVVK